MSTKGGGPRGGVQWPQPGHAGESPARPQCHTGSRGQTGHATELPMFCHHDTCAFRTQIGRQSPRHLTVERESRGSAGPPDSPSKVWSQTARAAPGKRGSPRKAEGTRDHRAAPGKCGSVHTAETPEKRQNPESTRGDMPLPTAKTPTKLNSPNISEALKPQLTGLGLRARPRLSDVFWESWNRRASLQTHQEQLPRGKHGRPQQGLRGAAGALDTPAPASP